MQSLTLGNRNSRNHFMKCLLGLCIVISGLTNKTIGQIAGSNSEATLGKSVQFKLTVSENTNKGKTSVIYVVTNTKLSLYQKPFGNQSYKEHIYTAHRFKSQSLLREIRKLNLGQLNPVYFNNCIAPGTGHEYHILLANGSKPISITLYQYYKHEVNALMQLLNQYLPSSFQIQYLTSDNKQDCGT